MILVDYSGSAINAILAFSSQLQTEENKVVDLIRHVVLSTLQSYKKQHGKKYGDLVIACDDRNYWRKDVYPHYKSKRKKSRDKSDLPWSLIFDTLNSIKDDLRENFPYKVISVPRVEADDVIAVLTKWAQENELVKTGLFEEPQPVMIISGDHDMIQLHRLGDVKQWSPITKKMIKMSPKDIDRKRIEHVVRGDSGDSIPNIMSDDLVFVNEERQKSVSSKRLEEFIEKGKDACQNDFERRNWDRNEQLTDFNFIPQDLQNEIINTYSSVSPVRNKNKVFQYLLKHRCRQLIESINDF